MQESDVAVASQDGTGRRIIHLLQAKAQGKASSSVVRSTIPSHPIPMLLSAKRIVPSINQSCKPVVPAYGVRVPRSTTTRQEPLAAHSPRPSMAIALLGLPCRSDARVCMPSRGRTSRRRSAGPGAVAAVAPMPIDRTKRPASQLPVSNLMPGLNQ
jgi:hypothetical protein